MEDQIVTNSNKSSSVERKARPQKEQALNCPRCNSTNTKFCYYNNYSLSQPRYFCKTCRRYWTEGGSLRNIPVGGGSRKNKRPSSNSPSNLNPPKKLPDLVQQNPNSNNNTPQDLNLGIYSTAPHHHPFMHLPSFDHTNPKDLQLNTSSSALELLTGMTGSAVRGLSSFIPMHQAMSGDPSVYNNSGSSSGGFHLPEFKSSLNFSLDGFGSNYGSFQGVEGSSGKQLLFPFEDLRQVSSGNNNNHNHNDDDNQANDGEQQINVNGDHEQNGNEADNSTTAGFWSGVIGGGSW